MNIDRNMLISFDTFNSCCAKRQKNCIFRHEFIKIAQNHSFTKIRMKIWHTCHLCVIWQHYPCNMYIHLHTIGLIGATELGTHACHFAPNQRRFQWSISRWILMRRNNIFGKKFKVELKFICAEFQIFSTLSKHDITILVVISHGNRSLTSYMRFKMMDPRDLFTCITQGCSWDTMNLYVSTSSLPVIHIGLDCFSCLTEVIWESWICEAYIYAYIYIRNCSNEIMDWFVVFCTRVVLSTRLPREASLIRYGTHWWDYTVKPVCNDHLYNKIYYLWFIQ